MKRGTRQHFTPSENLQHFTNRVNELELVRSRLDRNLGEPLPILMFYGVGGSGKTWVRRRIQEQLRNDWHIPFASLDFTREHGSGLGDDRIACLLEIARQLGVTCPRFETAVHSLRLKLSEGSQLGHDGSQGSNIEEATESALADIFGKLAEEIPGGFIAKLVRIGYKHFSAPERQKILREWVKTDEARSHLSFLAAANPPDISERLISWFGEDLRTSLPKRDGKPRAVILMDTLEHLRRGGLTGLQQFTDREKWMLDLYGALHELTEIHGEPYPYVQLILFGRDRLNWEDHDHDMEAGRDLEQHLVGGLSKKDALDFLGKCQISDRKLNDAILRVCREAKEDAKESGYHAFSLALCADTVVEDRERGIESAPESFAFPPGKQGALTRRFLQSLDDTTARRVLRLARTPCFDKTALQSLCVQGDLSANETQVAHLLGFSFVKPQDKAGWFSLHAKMVEGLSVQPCSDESRREHEALWRKLWAERSSQKSDEFAGLAWYHEWQLDREAAFKRWNEMAETARTQLRMADHLAFLGWWNWIGIESDRELDTFEANALVSLGCELQQTSLGSSRDNLDRAIVAYQHALTVFTREQWPQNWAMTQNNLGAALREQGIRISGPDAERYLGEAVTAYRAALEVRTREQLPQDWAMTQNNLGNALSDQGIRSSGSDAERLLGEAVTAYRAALEVRTREQLPPYWEKIQSNLDRALAELQRRQNA